MVPAAERFCCGGRFILRGLCCQGLKSTVARHVKQLAEARSSTPLRPESTAPATSQNKTKVLDVASEGGSAGTPQSTGQARTTFRNQRYRSAAKLFTIILATLNRHVNRNLSMCVPSSSGPTPAVGITRKKQRVRTTMAKDINKQ